MSVTETQPRLSYREMRTNAQVIRDEQVKEQVLNGLDLLNEKYGPGWVDKIDPRTLLIQSGTHCVLGQLYGTYRRGLEELGLTGPGNGWSDDEYKAGLPYGFYASGGRLLSFDGERSWERLTDGWLVTIGYDPRYNNWS